LLAQEGLTFSELESRAQDLEMKSGAMEKCKLGRLEREREAVEIRAAEQTARDAECYANVKLHLEQELARELEMRERIFALKLRCEMLEEQLE